MKHPVVIGWTSALLLLAACRPSMEEAVVTSPDGNTKVRVEILDGRPTYRVTWKGEEVVAPSELGFDLTDGPYFTEPVELTHLSFNNRSETWEQPWGEQRQILNRYREMKVRFTGGRHLTITFRVFADGVGFRYSFPAALDSFAIAAERTRFDLPDSARAWWIAAYQNDRFEYLFNETPLEAVADTVHTPFTVRLASGTHLSIHEAALTDFPSATLVVPTGSSEVGLDLVPWSNGIKAYVQAPFHTPWRTIRLAADAKGLLHNFIDLNLNEPSKLGDAEWVRPGKYVGIWWGMHLGTQSWASGPQHGATTAETKRYIDFAAANGLQGVLVEGWNPGWDGPWFGGGTRFIFTETHPDFDIAEVTRYAREKGVYLIGHHETGGETRNYEAQLDSAMAFYARYGVPVVKTGYVAHRLDKAEWHHGQYGVRHYRLVTETAAKYGIAVNIHEPIKDTGIRRTWPNEVSREGARGQEFNAWSGDGGNPVNHVAILPFTRLLSGPMDYTPGIFDLLLKAKAGPNPDGNRIHGTLARELSLYVIIHSPVQMAADLPEHYEGHPAFAFIRDVPADWESSIALEGEIGQYVTIARQDRNSDDWYVGTLSVDARTAVVPLAFLEEGQTYQVTMYRDGDRADWRTRPFDYEIETRMVQAGDTLRIPVAPGGGAAVRMVRMTMQ